MRRVILSFAVGVLLLLGLVATVGPRASADTAAHAVVGAWWTANDAPGPGVESAYVVFHADGTYLEADPNIGVGLGVWQATGARTADVTYIFQDIDPEPATTAPGTVTVRQAVTVDAAGDAFTAPLTVEVRLPDGTVVFTAAYTARGTRMTVEPIGPLGTPVAATTSR